MLDGLSPTTAILAVFTYPAYLLTMAAVLRACGVSREETAKWILRRADRQHLTDFVRSLRREPADPRDDRGNAEIAIHPDPQDAGSGIRRRDSGN